MDIYAVNPQKDARVHTEGHSADNIRFLDNLLLLLVCNSLIKLLGEKC